MIIRYAIALAVLFILAAAFRWAFLPARHLPGNRARHPSAKASDYLRGYLWAAALAGYDMRAVAACASGADPDIPERILIAAGARQWALTLAELRSEAHKTTATVLMVTSEADV
jgi:hypothetical protein